MESNLVSIKDIKLPTLKEDKPSTLTFRTWWKDLYKYCQRREHWRSAESVFKVLRNYPNELVPKEIFDFQNACTNKDSGPRGNNFDFTSWNFYDRDRELYQCVEIALNGKCSEIFPVWPKIVDSSS